MNTDDDRGQQGDDENGLVGEYALGLLEGEEYRRATSRIAGDPALRKELRFWQSRLARLDAEFAEARPPAAALARIERRLFATGRADPAGWWDSVLLWRGIAAASLALAALVAGLSLGLLQPRLDPNEAAQQLVAALEPQEGSGIEFVALYDPASGSVRLTALSGEVAPGRDLELWYIAGSEPAVSMGVIPVGKTEIELDPEARGKFGEGVILAVTLEQEGGSPTGVAQGPVVALGAATAI